MTVQWLLVTRPCHRPVRGQDTEPLRIEALSPTLLGRTLPFPHLCLVSVSKPSW